MGDTKRWGWRLSAIFAGSVCGCATDDAWLQAAPEGSAPEASPWTVPPMAPEADPAAEPGAFLERIGSLEVEGDARVDGVAVRDVQGRSVVGAAGAIWLATPGSAWHDVLDVLPGDERILGDGTLGDRWVSIVAADGQVTLVDEDGAVVVEPVGALAAAVGDGQLVALETSGATGAVVWRAVDGAVATVSVDPLLCASTSIAAGAGAAWLGTDEGLWRVDGAAVTWVPVGASHLAFDDVHGWLYAAASDGRVARVDGDGTVAWVASFEGAVVGIGDAGAQEAVLVVVDDVDGTRVLALDAVDGTIVGEDTLNGPGDSVVVAGDGSMLAQVWSPFVTWYRVGSVR